MDQPLALPSPDAAESSAAARNPLHNGWTRARMVAFLRELAASQSVHHAARSVGMSRQSAYRLRNRLACTPFALAWEVALESGLQQLAHAALDRALNGVERPHFYHGELVGTSRHYDNRLTAWLLANPWKVGRQQVARELAGETWDVLLEQIETQGPGWQPDGADSDPEQIAAEYEDRADALIELTHESWYGRHPASPARAERESES